MALNKAWNGFVGNESTVDTNDKILTIWDAAAIIVDSSTDEKQIMMPH